MIIWNQNGVFNGGVFASSDHHYGLTTNPIVSLSWLFEIEMKYIRGSIWANRSPVNSWANHQLNYSTELDTIILDLFWTI